MPTRGHGVAARGGPTQPRGAPARRVYGGPTSGPRKQNPARAARGGRWIRGGHRPAPRLLGAGFTGDWRGQEICFRWGQDRRAGRWGASGDNCSRIPPGRLARQIGRKKKTGHGSSVDGLPGARASVTGSKYPGGPEHAHRALLARRSDYIVGGPLPTREKKLWGNRGCGGGRLWARDNIATGRAPPSNTTKTGPPFFSA